MKHWYERNNPDDEGKRQLLRMLAFGIDGLGVNEVSHKSEAEERLIDDISRDDG